MITSTTFTITDDSGFLAIVNADKYASFVHEEWELPQLIEHFTNEMNNDALIIWATGLENTWTVRFVNEPSAQKSFREFYKAIDVTNSQLFLTNYEDLTMAAQYEDTKIPTKYNADLYIQLDNGAYELVIRQLFNPEDYPYEVEEKIDFEIVIGTTTKMQTQEINRIFWLNKLA